MIHTEIRHRCARIWQDIGGDGDGMWKPANLTAAKAEVQHIQCDVKSRAKGNDHLNFSINLLIIVSIQGLVLWSIKCHLEW